MGQDSMKGNFSPVFTNDQTFVEETVPDALAKKVSKQCVGDSDAETVFAEGELDQDSDTDSEAADEEEEQNEDDD